MRLTEQEKSGIITAIESQLEIKEAELKLYGSRVDDTQKGGDIDLILILSTEASKSFAIENKHKILAQIKQNIGDRKIDLLICIKQDIESDPFINMVYPSSVTIKKWVSPHSL